MSFRFQISRKTQKILFIDFLSGTFIFYSPLLISFQHCSIFSTCWKFRLVEKPGKRFRGASSRRRVRNDGCELSTKEIDHRRPPALLWNRLVQTNQSNCKNCAKYPDLQLTSFHNCTTQSFKSEIMIKDVL